MKNYLCHKNAHTEEEEDDDGKRIVRFHPYTLPDETLLNKRILISFQFSIISCSPDNTHTLLTAVVCYKFIKYFRDRKKEARAEFIFIFHFCFSFVCSAIDKTVPMTTVINLKFKYTQLDV